MLKQVLQDRRAEVLRIASQYGAVNIRVFGSVARGEDTAESDVDLLVDFDHPHSLLERVGLTLDLQDLLGKRVQVVTEPALHPYLRDRILQQAIPL